MAPCDSGWECGQQRRRCARTHSGTCSSTCTRAAAAARTQDLAAKTEAAYRREIVEERVRGAAEKRAREELEREARGLDMCANRAAGKRAAVRVRGANTKRPPPMQPEPGRPRPHRGPEIALYGTRCTEGAHWPSRAPRPPPPPPPPHAADSHTQRAAPPQRLGLLKIFVRARCCCGCGTRALHIQSRTPARRI